jgi:hypothetical protein
MRRTRRPQYAEIAILKRVQMGNPLGPVSYDRVYVSKKEMYLSCAGCRLGSQVQPNPRRMKVEV